MRLVKVKEYIYAGGNRSSTDISFLGYFHCWASGFEEFDDGPGNFTYAIVEMEDGKVRSFRPEDVTFVFPGTKI